MLSSREIARQTGGFTWVSDKIQSHGTFRTNLHDALHVFHGTVDGDLELFAYFLSESLEPRPREPVWKISYCPGFYQLFVNV